MGGELAWVAWVVCLRGWRANLGLMLSLLLLLLLKLNTTLKKKMLSVNFY